MGKLVADMTPEQIESRRVSNKKWFENLTPEQRAIRKEKQRKYDAKRNANRTPEQKAIKKEEDRKRYANLTPEQKEEELVRRKIIYENLPLAEKLKIKEHRQILRSTPESKKSVAEYSKNYRAKQKANSPCGVYFIRDEHNRTKIGKSDNIDERLISLQTGNADELTLFAYIETPGKQQAKIAEVIVQDYFKKDWIRGEWYNVSEEQIKMYAKNNKLYNIKICGFNRIILAA